VRCRNDNDAQSPHEGAKGLEALARGSGEPNWTKETIKERQARLATLAVKVWPR